MALFQAFTTKTDMRGCDKVRHMALQGWKIACSCHARGCSGVRDFRTGGASLASIGAVVSEASAKQVNGGAFPLQGIG